MTRRMFRLFGSAVIVFVVVGGVAVLPAGIAQDPSCTYVKDWAVTHAADLPKTLGELTTIPREFRRGIFASLPSDIQSGIVCELFRLVIDEAHLTGFQRATLELAIAGLTPALYQGARDAQRDGTLTAPAVLMAQDIETKLREAFPGHEAAQIAFVALPQGFCVRAAVLRLQAIAWLRRTVHAAPLDPCQCSIFAARECSRIGDCPGWLERGTNQKCSPQQNWCDPTGSGCGISGALACDGRCNIVDCPQDEHRP